MGNPLPDLSLVHAHLPPTAPPPARLLSVYNIQQKVLVARCADTDLGACTCFCSCRLPMASRATCTLEPEAGPASARSVLMRLGTDEAGQCARQRPVKGEIYFPAELPCLKIFGGHGFSKRMGKKENEKKTEPDALQLSAEASPFTAGVLGHIGCERLYPRLWHHNFQKKLHVDA